MMSTENFIRTEKQMTSRGGALYTIYYRVRSGIVMKRRMSQHKYKSEGYDILYPCKEDNHKEYNHV